MSLGVFDINFTEIMSNFTSWALQGYETALGFVFWPLVFTGIIGYVYLKNQSLVALAGGILIVFAVFGNALMDVQIWINLLYIAVAAITAALFVMLFLHGRNR